MTRAIRVYQGTVSRLLPPLCRYYPSCSQYAIETFENRGLCQGARFVVGRLLRCHPFASGGFDPTPAPLPHEDHGPSLHRSSD